MHDVCGSPVVQETSRVKQFKSTGALLVLVMLVVGYAYFFEYKGKIQKAAQDTQSKKIIPFSLEDTIEFSVKNFAEEYLFKKLEAQKTWVMEKPLFDVASFAAIQGFLSQFGQEIFDDIVAEGPGIDYSIYGLNDKDPKERISVVNFKTKDKSISIEIGSATAIAGKKYIRLNKEEKVRLAGYFWESQFQKSLSELREKSFIPSEISIEKIEIQYQDKMSFEQLDGKWTLKELLTKDPDQKTVDDIYYQIKNLRATQIFKEGKNPSDLANLSLTEPEIKIKVSGNVSGVPKSVDLIFSKNLAGQVYATSTDRNLIFSLNPPSVVAFRKTIEDFRDKKKPLSFSLAEVSEIEYKSSFVNFNLKKQNDTWISTENLKDMEVDSTKVVDLLNKVSLMKVDKYFDQEVTYQKSGMSELKLKSSNGQNILELEWSGRPVGDVFVAKSNLDTKTFGLSMQDISSLPFQSILKQKQNAAEKLIQ